MKKEQFLAIFAAVVIVFTVAGRHQSVSAQLRDPVELQKGGSSVVCTPPPSGLVSWYRAENSADDPVSGNTGSLQNGAGFAAGQVGQALSFDGTDDFVSISGHPSLDVGAGNGMTIETWIKPASIATQKPIVDWDAGSTVGTHLWYSVTSAGGVTGNIFFNLLDTGGTSHILQTPAVMTPGEFQHIAATYDKITGDASIYRNGQLVSTANLGSFTPRTSQAFSLYLGTRPGTGVFYEGLMDETSIYDNALQQAQIQNIYDAGTLGKCANACSASNSGLISWYRGENNGIDAHLGNNGILFNSTNFAAGKVGRAFSMNGAGDYIEIPNSANLQPATLTLEAWVNFASLESTVVGNAQGTQRLIHKQNARSGGQGLFASYELGKTRQAGQDKMYFCIDSNGGSEVCVLSSTVVAAGQWYHVAATYDAQFEKIYVNGNLEGTTASTQPLEYANKPVLLGRTNDPAFDGHLNGLLDEAAIYGRALDASEIQNIFTADSTGKCKVCISPPANLNSWFPADITASDVQSGNTNASMIGDTTIATDAKVGKAFSFDGGGDYISIPDAPEQKPTDQLTFEGWYKFNTLGAGLPHLIAKPLRNSPFDSYAVWFDVGNLRIGYQDASGSFIYYDTGFVPQTGVYYHFAYTLDTTDSGPTANTMKLFVNGVQVFSGAAALPIYYNGVNDALLPHPLLIGADLENNNPQFFLDGKADEVSLYGRTLSAAEIKAIYDSQSAGKCHGQCTAAPAGLVSWYTGNGNPRDTRSGNNGTPQGGTSYAAGKVGQGFSFDGVDDSVDLGSWFTLTDFTLSIWLKPGASQVEFADIIDNNHTGSQNWVLQQIGNSTNLYSFSGTPNFSLTPNIWQHLVITHDNSGGIRVYIDGSLVTTGSFAIPYNGTQFLRLGRWGNSLGLPSNRNWNGQMDEFAVFNRALSASEVQAITTADTAGLCKPTAVTAPSGHLAWLTGDGDALDASGNSNNGVLNNGAKFAVGKVGQSFDLDGGDDTVTVPDSPNVRPASALTVEGWFKFDAINDLSGTGNHMVAKPLGSSFGDSYVLWLGSGRIWVGVGDSPTTGTFFDTGYTVQTGVWYHIAMTFDDATNALRCFVNGVEIASTTTSVTIAYDNHPLVIGSDITNENFNFFNDGQEDEVSLYNRALDHTEINSIYNAGVAGKLTAATTITSTGLVSAWRAEDNANDTLGTNNGTLTGGTFTGGILGRGFLFDGVDDVVSVPDSPSLNLASNAPVTVEMWAYRTSTGGIQHMLGKRFNCDGSPINYQLAYAANQVFFGGGSGNEVGSLQDLPLNKWTHIAGTFDGSTFRIYLNGTLANSAGGTLGGTNSAPVLIGGSGTCGTFGGALDEVGLYSRALSAAEIQAQFQAKSPAVTGIGDVTVNLGSVTTAGTTEEIPLDRATLPPLPMGVTSLGLTYDIATSALYAGNANLCFNVPALSATTAANLRVYHLENGVWVNRTAPGATHTALCTTGVTSLSPFAIGALPPTAANVAVGGRVLTADGRGISNAFVSLTDSQGIVHNVVSGSLGYYSFEGVLAGGSCVVSVSAKRYRFATSTMLITATDNMTNVDFTANP